MLYTTLHYLTYCSFYVTSKKIDVLGKMAFFYAFSRYDHPYRQGIER